MAGGHGVLGSLSSQQSQTPAGRPSNLLLLYSFEDVLNFPTGMPIPSANRKGILINNPGLAL